MKTVTVKVKFKALGVNKTKTVKVSLEFPNDSYPCFSKIVDEVYKSCDPKLNNCFNYFGYIIGVGQILK